MDFPVPARPVSMTNMRSSSLAGRRGMDIPYQPPNEPAEEVWDARREDFVVAGIRVLVGIRMGGEPVHLPRRLPEMRKILLAPILVAGFLAAAVAPSGAWSSDPRPTIAQIVANSGGKFDSNHYDYDILYTAVKAAGLVDALNDPSTKLTLFAPNDMAFIRTARDFGFTGSDEGGAFDAIAGVLGTLDPKGKGDPIPALKNVLLYHVTTGSLNPIQVLFSGSIHTLLPGASFDVRFLRLVDNAPRRPDPYLNLFALNIKASNGVIHGITRVLLPVDA
jgi:uncharacterized surface protein with fasciclin (FAS1) repeats